MNLSRWDTVCMCNDAAHNEIGFIKQKLFCFLPTFEIEWNGQLMGHIEKRFALFRPKYDAGISWMACRR